MLRCLDFSSSVPWAGLQAGTPSSNEHTQPFNIQFFYFTQPMECCTLDFTLQARDLKSFLCRRQPPHEERPKQLCQGSTDEWPTSSSPQWSSELPTGYLDPLLHDIRFLNFHDYELFENYRPIILQSVLQRGFVFTFPHDYSHILFF